MNRRKNIALFIGMLETEFSNDICEGALLGAQKIDANLFVFPAGIIDGRYEDADYDSYWDQYNVLYSYLESNAFDAVIIEYSTVTSRLNMEKKREFLKNLGDVPIILIGANLEGYSSIGIDNKTGMEEAVAHLIEQHHCSKIGFVSGPKTNQDARDRLDAYLETMRKHEFEVSEEWIIYGDFSEYQEDMMKEFILKNPDVEAIVFANDQMAMSGYKAMEKLQLIPGKDILITGFDDSPHAMLWEPHLTSVKVDPEELAYNAVVECLNVIAGEEVHRLVKSHLVVRASCGCNDLDVTDRMANIMPDEMFEDQIKQLADDMFEKYFNNYLKNVEKVRAKEIIEEYFDYYFHMIQPDGSLDFNKEEFEKEYRQYMQAYLCGYIDLKQFLLIDRILYEYLCKQTEDEKSRLYLSEQKSVLYGEMISNVTVKKIVSFEKSRFFETALVNITSDMLQYPQNEQKRYKTVIDKLQKMRFASSCIFTYEQGVENLQKESWKMPERLYVKACHDRDMVRLYKENEQEVKLGDIFSSRFVPDDRRVDILVIPMFSNRVQYGLILFESELESFRYAVQIACQVSVSMEIVEILEKQNAIKRELEQNLARTVANNKLLDEMSRMDPLTGVFNRRGFYYAIKEILSDTGNYGKKAIAIYADMDNLKVINDKFGHDEGDFAIKASAKALVKSMCKLDVIGRMGGDEFAVFAIVDGENSAEVIREKIRSNLKEFNEYCDKPYYINLSVGMYEFVLDEESNLEYILSEADSSLYEEKKHKSKNIYKRQSNS